MTLEEILNQIHVLVEGNVDYPASSEDTYLTRLERVKVAIGNWENEEGVLWNELFVSLDDAGDGDKTVSAGVAEYETPTDFKFPTGLLRLVDDNGGTSYYPLVKTGNVQLVDKAGNSFWYLTGNRSVGFTIHLHPTPGDNDDGKSIKYEYYKEASIPTSGDDIVEMSDPLYIVYWAASEELKEENPALSDYYLQVAINKLNAMKLRNDMPTWGQESTPPNTFSGFGE